MSARVAPLRVPHGSFDSVFDPSWSPVARTATAAIVSPTASPLPPAAAYQVITTTAHANSSGGGAQPLDPGFVKNAIRTVQVKPAPGTATPSLMEENANPPPVVLEHRKVVFRNGKGGLLYYDGDLLGRVPHGKGVMESEDKTRKYVGHFEHGERSGKGILSWPGHSYDGSWKAGKKEGQGTLQVDGVDGFIYYTGQWVNGQKQGSFSVAQGQTQWYETYRDDQLVTCCGSLSCTLL